jgi:hypothetical protein
MDYNCLNDKCVKAENMRYLGFCYCKSRFGCDFRGVKTGTVKWFRYNKQEG